MSGPGKQSIYRALATIGGGLGALPLLALARSLAASLFEIPHLPGGERLTRDLKEATYFEVGVLLVCVPAAAIFFGRILPTFLERRGFSAIHAYLPGTAFAISFVLWTERASATTSLIAALALATIIISSGFLPRPRPESQLSWTLHSRIVALVIVVVVFLSGLFVFYRPAKPLDLFEDGLILFGATSLANGGRPYVDVYPIHGWGADGGLNAILFRFVQHDLAAFHVLRAVVTALAVATLAVACLLFFQGVGWGALGFLASLAFCPFLSERHMPALIAYCFLIQASRTGKLRNWIWAGLVSGITLFVTLDFGLMLLAAGVAGPVVLGLLERTPLRGSFPAIVRFSSGFLLGFLPLAVILAVDGVFLEFLRVSFVEVPRSITPAWGLPAASFAGAIRDRGVVGCLELLKYRDVPSLCALLLVLLIAIVVLLIRASDRLVERSDRAAAICLLLAALALRGVLGRADEGHQMIYGLFAGLPAAWLLYRAWNAAPRFRPAAFGLAVIALALLLRPDRTVRHEVIAIARAEEIRSREAINSVRVSWNGSPRLPRAQARDLERLRFVIDEAVPIGRTFFDFGNEPALYFLMNRRPPIRYSHVPSYETVEKQNEVIAALERARPPIAILSSGTGSDRFDSVSNRERAPLVARFLDRNYRVIGKVGKRTLAAWKNP